MVQYFAKLECNEITHRSSTRHRRKWSYCQGCDAPHDRRIPRAKDPTNGTWFCTNCWLRHRTNLFDSATPNNSWMECHRCGMGAFPGNGRFMESGLFYCKLCWKGWIGSMPQKSDWVTGLPNNQIKKTNEPLENIKEEKEENALSNGCPKNDKECDQDKVENSLPNGCPENGKECKNNLQHDEALPNGCPENDKDRKKIGM